MSKSELLREAVPAIQDINREQALTETARLRFFGPARRLGSTGIRLADERSPFLVAGTEVGRLADIVRDVADKKGLNLRRVFAQKRTGGYSEGSSKLQTLEVPQGREHTLTLASGHTAIAAIEGGLKVSQPDQEPFEIGTGEVVFVTGNKPEIGVQAENDHATALLLHGDTEPPRFHSAGLKQAA